MYVIDNGTFIKSLADAERDITSIPSVYAGFSVIDLFWRLAGDSKSRDENLGDASSRGCATA
jgi:hypothetical protein